MAKLYIANCTQQAQDFLYRTLGSNVPRLQRIDIGSQVQISGDLTTEEIDYIVQQHVVYGMVRADEIDRTKAFAGVCYSVGKPIPVDKIRVGLTHNQQVLIERGKELRQQAAVAVSNALEAERQGLQSLEMSVVEERKDGGAPEIAEGTRVTRMGDGGPLAAVEPARGGRRGGGRRGGG